MVYYRKYRPQTISELDLPSVREKISAILSSKDLPHALLFTGSKGLGKTSSARIFAKAINCEGRLTFGTLQLEKDTKSQKPIANSSIEPCNKCDACITITNGSNIDVLEIDAASNGGVEEIRALREKIKFSPSNLQYKVYIIDEVHMLSTGAFNALLKTLEEPPAHVIFILATTELNKLPDTVVSRTFQIQFEKPTSEQIAKSLERIVRGEGLLVESEVLIKIADISDGAFRDAAKNLEELVLASNGGKIDVATYDRVFKTQGVTSEVENLLEAYDRRDAKKALEIIAKLYEDGCDFKIVIEKIVDNLRGLLMLRNKIPSEVKDIPGLDMADIQNLLNMANEAYGELKVSIIPQLPLELMTVKFCILDSESENKIKNEELRIKGDGNKTGSIEVLKETEKSESLDPKEQNGGKKQDILGLLINDLNQTNKPGAALLRSAKSAEFVNDTLTIITPFPIHAERLMSEKVFVDLKIAAKHILGNETNVKIVVG